MDPRRHSIGPLAGFTVWIVDGAIVRDHLDVEFALGGHHGRYPFIPEDEVWLEDTGDLDDVMHNARHEVIEAELMRDLKMTYDEAHAEASAIEARERRSNPEAPPAWGHGGPPTDEAVEAAVEEAHYWMEHDPSGGAEVDLEVPLGKALHETAAPLSLSGLISYSMSMHPCEASVREGAADAWHDYRAGVGLGATEEAGLYLGIESVWKQGRLEELPPIIVRQTGTILDGWRRLVVALAHGQDTGIPALVVTWPMETT
jgi:hypothetical protein